MLDKNARYLVLAPSLRLKKKSHDFRGSSKILEGIFILNPDTLRQDHQGTLTRGQTSKYLLNEGIGSVHRI